MYSIPPVFNAKAISLYIFNKNNPYVNIKLQEVPCQVFHVLSAYISFREGIHHINMFLDIMEMLIEQACNFT